MIHIMRKQLYSCDLYYLFFQSEHFATEGNTSLRHSSDGSEDQDETHVPDQSDEGLFSMSLFIYLNKYI